MSKSIVAPLKPVEVANEPVMIAVSKAQAMAWVLENLADEDSNLFVAIEDASHPEEVRPWLQGVVAEALHTAHDKIEREYRKLGTNLLVKEATELSQLKDGA